MADPAPRCGVRQSAAAFLFLVRTYEDLHNGGMNAAFCDGHAKWIAANVAQPTQTEPPAELPWVGP